MQVRLSPAQIKQLDWWIKEGVENMTRAEAIRRLMAMGLKAEEGNL